MAFGTSGHRGSSLNSAFNENHILAISQALCDVRRAKGISGPLFLGIDTHALAEPARASALEVFAANGVEVMIDEHDGYTPTPVISHAIIGYNKGREKGLADGVVVSPSHNPPEDGGFKYNPPNGGPADTDITGAIERAANGFWKPISRASNAFPMSARANPPACIGLIMCSLCRRSRFGHRYGSDQGVRRQDRHRSLGRRRCALFSAYHRALWYCGDHRQR